MEKKIKFGCVAWGLPGGGYFGPQIAKEAGLDGIQLELGSYEWGYPLAQNRFRKRILKRNRLGIEYPSIVLNDVMDHEFIHGKDTENGKIAYDQMELAVQVAAEMGISKIMVPKLPFGNLITEESHVEATKDALRFICEKAEKKDITVMTENALDYKEQIQLLKRN